MAALLVVRLEQMRAVHWELKWADHLVGTMVCNWADWMASNWAAWSVARKAVRTAGVWADLMVASLVDWLDEKLESIWAVTKADWSVVLMAD